MPLLEAAETARRDPMTTTQRRPTTAVTCGFNRSLENSKIVIGQNWLLLTYGFL